ncbi:MAG: hypothetical protein J6S67_12475 [Methanobrevibacter sp.]|nr:hypothetical protein [Methanobrevibacter sp.]
MCKRSPSVAYVYKKINTTRKSVLYAELEDSPLSVRDFAFVSDIITGLNIQELADKYHKTPARISQWKREVCEKIHAFDIANMTRR